MYKLAMKMFYITIIIATILSIYLLLHLIYNKKHKDINAWWFPMLLAILIELYVDKQY